MSENKKNHGGNGDNMTAKEYLSQAARITARLKVMAEQLEYLKAAAAYVVTQFSDMPKPATRNIHKSEDAIVRVIDFEDAMRRLFATLEEITAVINSVSDTTAQAILTKRYLAANTWEQISRELYVSRSRVFELHTAALAEIEKSGLNRTVSDE
jgi:DNA-directed RNA polymerase specialized sigma subunit